MDAAGVKNGSPLTTSPTLQRADADPKAAKVSKARAPKVPQTMALPQNTDIFENTRPSEPRQAVTTPEPRATDTYLNTLSAVRIGMYAFGNRSNRVEIEEFQNGRLVALVDSEAAGTSQLRIPLSVVDGELKGETINAGGQRISVALSRTQAGFACRLSTQAGKLDLNSVSKSQDRSLEKLLTAAKAEATKNTAAQLASDPTIPPIQREAMRTIVSLTEGPGVSTAKFLQILKQRPELTATDAATAPLLFAWATAGCGKCKHDADWEHCAASLRSNLTQIRNSLPEGSGARRILDISLSDYDPEVHVGSVGVHILEAGLVGARLALAETAPSDPTWLSRQLQKGWEVSLLQSYDRDVSPNQHTEILSRCANGIARSLPEAHPAREALLAAIGQLPLYFSADTTGHELALALGQAWSMLGPNKPAAVSNPTPNAEGMPTLPQQAQALPVFVREVTGELGATDASWQDVGQSHKLGDCWFASSWLNTALTRPEAIAERVQVLEPDPESPNNGRRVAVTLNYPDKNGVWKPTRVVVDGRIYVDADGKPLLGADRRTEPGADRRFWFSMVEKAAAASIHHLESNRMGYSGMTAGTAVNALKMIFGDVVQIFEIPEHTPQEALALIQSGLEKSQPLMVSSSSDWEALRGSGLTNGHMYSLTGLEKRDGEYYVTVTDPYPARTVTEATNLYEHVFREFVANGEARSDMNKPFGQVTMPLTQFMQQTRRITWANLPAKITEESRRRAGL